MKKRTDWNGVMMNEKHSCLAVAVEIALMVEMALELERNAKKVRLHINEEETKHTKISEVTQSEMEGRCGQISQIAECEGELEEEASGQNVVEVACAVGTLKRAQEVILFGNQQNRPAETTYFHNPDKRVERDDDDDLLTTMAPSAYQEDEEEALSAGKSVAQYEKGYKYGVGKEALDKHVENALLKSELYGEPSSVNQYRYYGGGDDQRGREEGLFAVPNKRRTQSLAHMGLRNLDVHLFESSSELYFEPRTFSSMHDVDQCACFRSREAGQSKGDQASGSSSFRPMVPHALPATQQGVARLKRDLELDPEDVLALLSLWEAQHHNNYPYRAPVTNWPQYNGYESPDDFDTPEDDGNTEDEEESPNGNWLEGPVYPSSATTYPGGHYSLEKRPSYYYPSYPVQKREGQWGTFPKDKRFMVSRKRQKTPGFETETSEYVTRNSDH
uniref:Uncharacterized protein n=1 Tax=Timema tahoe TaxID=61484 RepID=A0A7R9IEM1_9NEOP|nr:unnamed protein product [Timema tahoe]